MEAYLLECPLCGKAPEVKTNHEGTVLIQCVSGDAHVVQATGQGQREALMKWNKRRHADTGR